MGLDKFYGVVAIVSLQADLRLDWNKLYQKSKKMGIDLEAVPTPTPAHEADSVVEIKEVRRAIEKELKRCLGVRVRESGGVVFVPRTHVCQWIAFCNFLAGIEGIEIINLDVYETNTNKRITYQGLVDDVRRRLKDEVKKVTKKRVNGTIREIAEALSDGLRAREINIRAKDFLADRLDDTAKKVNLYEKLLNMDLSLIRDDLNKVKGALWGRPRMVW